MPEAPPTVQHHEAPGAAAEDPVHQQNSPCRHEDAVHARGACTTRTPAAPEVPCTTPSTPKAYDPHYVSTG